MEKNEQIAKEMAETITAARGTAVAMSAMLNGKDTRECIAAVGILLALILESENEVGRKMARVFFDIAFNSALKTIDEMRKRKAQ